MKMTLLDRKKMTKRKKNKITMMIMKKIMNLKVLIKVKKIVKSKANMMNLIMKMKIISKTKKRPKIFQLWIKQMKRKKAMIPMMMTIYMKILKKYIEIFFLNKIFIKF